MLLVAFATTKQRGVFPVATGCIFAKTTQHVVAKHANFTTNGQNNEHKRRPSNKTEKPAG